MEDSKKLLFSIPDFYNQYNLNMLLLQLMKDEPGLFREDVVIESVYGCFPGVIWNSGRAAVGQATLENVIGTVAAFNQLGISVRYTFTNSLLTGRHMMDFYANTICQATEHIVEGIKNGCNVNSEVLADHLAKNYPDFYLMWSTTKRVKTVEDINKMSEDRLVVLDYAMNNTDALDKLEHPENVEVLCNEACIDNCPNRLHHYEDISKLQLMMPSEGFKCPHGCEQYYYYDMVPKRNHHISIDDIYEIYLPRGINKFKLSGRHDNPVNIIENYALYFSKPEYVDNVRNKLLINFFSGIIPKNKK